MTRCAGGEPTVHRRHGGTAAREVVPEISTSSRHARSVCRVQSPACLHDLVAGGTTSWGTAGQGTAGQDGWVGAGQAPAGDVGRGDRSPRAPKTAAVVRYPTASTANTGREYPESGSVTAAIAAAAMKAEL